MYNCSYCNNEISTERVEALEFLGKKSHEFSCVSCAEKFVPKVKGFYQGASGVSNLNIVKNLGNEERLTPIIIYDETEMDIQLEDEESY